MLDFCDDRTSAAVAVRNKCNVVFSDESALVGRSFLPFGVECVKIEVLEISNVME